MTVVRCINKSIFFQRMTVRGQGKRFVWGIEAVLAGRLMGYFFFECFLVVEVNERSLYNVTDGIVQNVSV